MKPETNAKFEKLGDTVLQRVIDSPYTWRILVLALIVVAIFALT